MLAAHLSGDPAAGDVLAGLAAGGLLVAREPRPGGDAYAVHPLLADHVRHHLAAGGVDAVRARATGERPPPTSPRSSRARARPTTRTTSRPPASSGGSWAWSPSTGPAPRGCGRCAARGRRVPADARSCSRSWARRRAGSVTSTPRRARCWLPPRARAEGAAALASDALEALAVVRFARGRPREAGRLAEREAPSGDGFATVRALVALHHDPWSAAWAVPAPPAGARHLERFWGHLAAGVVAALQGRARRGLELLDAPVEVMDVPRVLRVARVLVRALVAAAADDVGAVSDAAEGLVGLGADGEARLAEGLRAVVQRDLDGGLRHLRAAAEAATLAQPDARTLALVTAAQVAEAGGDHELADRLLASGVVRAERRGDALPLVGWVGHVPPVTVVLARVAATAWTARALRAGRRAGPLHVAVARTSASRAEAVRAAHAGHRVVPALTVRERDVLDRLARGASYADIAVDLVLSANTVKTHVTSLYAKLGATRRSEALATARTLDLL